MGHIAAPELLPVNKGARLQRLGYPGLVILANALIWGSAFLYLKMAPPIYTSKWAVTLPGAAPGINVNLPDVGEASSTNSNPPTSSETSDPRANYKFIVSSQPVLTAAADSINMTLEEFEHPGQPRVKLIDNTTIMEFEVKGSTPVETQQKSLALYQAFIRQLNLLRAEDVAQRNEAAQSTLRSAKSRLAAAQKRLSNYKARSGLSSSEQLRDLSVNIEDLRKQQAEALAQEQQAGSRLKRLASNLSLSPQQASDAFALQADDLFKQHSKDYSDTSAELVKLQAKFQANHPAVVEKKAEQQSAQRALLARSRSLMGKSVNHSTLGRLNLSPSSPGAARESLFQQLVVVQADQGGLKAQAEALNQQINQLESRLKSLTQKESTLESLRRDAQLTEAVFTSTIAKLDLSKSDI
ncbi:MAG TPA: hypothetical protein V6D03_01925, partial [Candidatus Caenarcaniphilales bacterium]